MNPRNSFIRFLATVVAIVLLLVAQVRAAARDVLASASSQAVFVAHVETVQNGIEHLASVQSSIYRRMLGGNGKFTKLVTLGGRVISLASQSDQAIVLLENGQWMTVWTNENPIGPAIRNAQILTMTGASDGVWAIAMNRAAPVASTTQSMPTTATGAATTTATTPVSAASNTTSNTPSNIGAGLILYHFNKTRWEAVAPLPEGINTLSPDDLSVAVNGSIVTVAAGGFEGIRVWAREANQWTEGRTIRSGHLPQNFRVLECGAPPLVWLSADNEQWLARNGTDQQLPADGASASAPRSAACVAEAVRVFSETDGKLSEQAYTLDAKPVGNRAQLTIDTSVPGNDVESWISTGLTVLVTALLVNSAWRREPVTPEVLQAANAVLAPHGLRLLAGAIDMLPLLIASTIGAAMVGRNTAFADMTQRQMVPFYIGIALYIFHTALGEILAGRSLGKWVTGLRVMSVDGTSLSAPAVLIRNVLRLIDVMLMWIPLVLILFSPMRQRLGDVAARTIVVKNAPAQKKEE